MHKINPQQTFRPSGMAGSAGRPYMHLLSKHSRFISSTLNGWLGGWPFLPNKPVVQRSGGSFLGSDSMHIKAPAMPRVIVYCAGKSHFRFCEEAVRLGATRKQDEWRETSARCARAGRKWTWRFFKRTLISLSSLLQTLITARNNGAARRNNTLSQSESAGSPPVARSHRAHFLTAAL